MKPLKTLVLNTLTFGLCLTFLTGCQTLQTFVNDVETTFNQITSPSTDNNAQQMAAESAPDAQTMLETAVVSPDFCPQVEIVEELSSLSEFADPSSPDQADLISRVNLSQVESTCEHKDKTIVVDLKLAFESMLGPRGIMREGDRPFFSYPFFVAVTDPQGEIMAKEVFAASMTFRAGEDRHTYYESLRQIIPHTGTKHQAALHKVLIGFQLSQNQLDYNRAFMRKRVSVDVNKPQMAILPVYNAQGESPSQPQTDSASTAAPAPAPVKKAMEPILLTPRAKPEQPIPIETVVETVPVAAPVTESTEPVLAVEPVAAAPQPEPQQEQEQAQAPRAAPGPVIEAVVIETPEAGETAKDIQETGETSESAEPPPVDTLAAPEAEAEKTTITTPDLFAPAAIEPEAGSTKQKSSVFEPLDITAPIQ